MSKKFNVLVQLHWEATENERYAIWALIAPILNERFPIAGDVKVINMNDGTTLIGYFTELGVVPEKSNQWMEPGFKEAAKRRKQLPQFARPLVTKKRDPE
jgi:hypothetical protein